jgi:hypothetical protein
MNHKAVINLVELLCLRAAVAYGLDDQGVGIRVPVGSRISSSPYRPDWLWGLLSLLSNEYQGLFPRG